MSSSSTTPRPHPRPAGMDEKGHMLYQRLARDCLFCQLARAGNARLLDGTSFKKTRSARSKRLVLPWHAQILASTTADANIEYSGGVENLSAAFRQLWSKRKRVQETSVRPGRRCL